MKWSNVVTIINGKNQKAVVNEKGKYPIYGSGGIIGFADDYLCETGTTIIGRKGTINSPIFVNERFWNVDTAFGIQPKACLNPKYLFFFCLFFNFKSLDKSTTIPSLAKRDLLNIDMPVPALEEQYRIVAKIEELFSQLDSGVETLKKTKQQLAVYRQAVLKEAFEGKFTESWRKKNGFDSWKTVKIETILKQEKNAIKAGPFGSALKKECYVPFGYKVYGQEQVIAGDETIGDYYIDESKYQELLNCKVQPQDILISLVGTIGKVLVLSSNCKQGIINPRLIKITLDSSKMLPMFFKYYFESGYLRSLYKAKVHGATMEVLNLRMIKELPFPLCTIQEQILVIEEIESRLSICDSIEKTVDDALQQAEALRQSILKKAFEGEL